MYGPMTLTSSSTSIAEVDSAVVRDDPEDEDDVDESESEESESEESVVSEILRSSIKF